MNQQLPPEALGAGADIVKTVDTRLDLTGSAFAEEEFQRIGGGGGAFTRFFLQICLDQVDFMAALVEPERLHARLRLWAEEEIQLDRLPAQTAQILDALLYRGALPRGDIPALLGVRERQARRIVKQVLTARVVSSASPRAAITLAFPATLALRWLPGLFLDARG